MKFPRMLFVCNGKVDSRKHVYLDELNEEEVKAYLEAFPELKKWVINEDNSKGVQNNVVTKPKQKRGKRSASESDANKSE